MKTAFKAGDSVLIITGADKGKTGKVIKIDRVQNRVLVEGINLKTNFVRKSEKTPQGGMIKKEAPIHMSNVKKAEGTSAKAEKSEKTEKTSKEAKKSLSKKA